MNADNPNVAEITDVYISYMYAGHRRYARADKAFALNAIFRLEPPWQIATDYILDRNAPPCSHAWRAPLDSQFNEVRCVFCGMPGEPQSDGSVFFPAT